MAEITDTGPCLGVQVLHGYVFSQPLLHEHREGGCNKARNETRKPEEDSVEGIARNLELRSTGNALGGIDKTVRNNKALQLSGNSGKLFLRDVGGTLGQSRKHLNEKGSDYGGEEPRL